MMNKIAKVFSFSVLVLAVFVSVLLMVFVFAGEGYEIDWENPYINSSGGSNVTFAGGIVNLTGTANITNITNWTITHLDTNGNSRILCNGTSQVNETNNSFCQWNTSVDCADEGTNHTLIISVTNDTGTYTDYIYNITIDNTSPDVGEISEENKSIVEKEETNSVPFVAKKPSVWKYIILILVILVIISLVFYLFLKKFSRKKTKKN
jgi:hypothetical protein